MIEAYDTRSIREAEEPLLAQGVPLMERAACGLATVVMRELRVRRGSVRGAAAVLLVGSGNNGGDALYAGARLARRGVVVTAFLLGHGFHEAGASALRAAGGEVIEAASTVKDGNAHLVADSAREADIVVDGLLGIGSAGGLRGAAGTVVRALIDLLGERAGVCGALTGSQPRGPFIVAVDVPSGVGVDDGSLPTAPGQPAASGPIVLRADLTVTFGAAKPCLVLPPAASYAGRVEVVDVGLCLADAPPVRRTDAVRRVEEQDLARLGVLAAPAVDAHKYSRGVLGVVAGTERFPGAGVLTVSGAVRAGIGMVRYFGSAAGTTAVLAARPEVVPAGGRVQAWAVGSGIPTAPASTDDDARSQRGRVRQALAQCTGELSSDLVGDVVPAVVDAGALSLLPVHCPPWIVITPHAGELAELLRARGDSVEREEIEAEPVRWARRAREVTGATVLLKGPATVVVGPSGVFSQADGSSWLATAGAGDVLAGILGALLAAHSVAATKDPALPALLAASAALLHGRAAHRANPGGPVGALDVADAVPATIAHLLAPHDG